MDKSTKRLIGIGAIGITIGMGAIKFVGYVTYKTVTAFLGM